MKLNENIRNFRRFRNMSQAELARLMSKSKSVISHWENGENSPDLDSVEKLCQILKVSPNELFGWEENIEYVEHIKRINAIKDQINKLQESKESIEAQISQLEIQMYKEENPLLDIDTNE